MVDLLYIAITASAGFLLMVILDRAGWPNESAFSACFALMFCVVVLLHLWTER
jgi:hypothetical protein